MVFFKSFFHWEVRELKKPWITKNKDMQIAKLIMEKYAAQQQLDALSLFELVVNQQAKRMDFQLSSWVNALLQQYHSMYGLNRGEQITRLVISACMHQGQTLH